MSADDLLLPHVEPMPAALPGLDVFDVHTHVGANDPSGFGAMVPELVPRRHGPARGRRCSR